MDGIERDAPLEASTALAQNGDERHREDAVYDHRDCEATGDHPLRLSRHSNV